MKTFQSLICLLLLAPAVGVAATPQLGVNPVPVVKNLGVQAAISYDAGTQFYTYTYAVTNPPSNTGSIWLILLDMTAPLNYMDSSGSVLTMPRGAAGNVTFNSELQSIMRPSVPINFHMIPFGITAPSGWNGTVHLAGTGGFVAYEPAGVDPGQTVGGLSLISPGLPTIKTMQLIPWWVLDMGTTEADEDQMVQAAQIEKALVVNVSVLAPSWVYPGSFDHWNQLQKDLATAIQLGWIADTTLAQTITSQLRTARADMDAAGPDYKTVAALQALLATVTAAKPGQLTTDGFNLLSSNLNAMLNVFGNPQPPQPQTSPVASFVNPPGPSYLTSAAVGASVTITAQVVDQAQNNAPLANYIAPLSVISGPDAGVSTSTPTDANGQISLTYKGAAVGQDTIAVTLQGPAVATAAVRPFTMVLPTNTATVIWKGGPDLIISEFTPPTIESDGQRPIHFTDTTQNIGDTPIGPSTTQYYLSTTTPVDPKTAVPVGQRAVSGLAPGQQDFFQTDVPFPSAAGGAGIYFLTACANGDRAVIETNYDNNCEVRQIAVALKRVNPPPDCSKAQASPALLWPPNHKLVTTAITGVQDPDGEPVTIKITKITQDEPVNGLGDGDTSPDGFGIGQPQAQVRAERSGLGNGRVYAITFTAADTAGGTCSATVKVGVPHDQGQDSTPIDDGQKYDSTSLN